jgi:predicted RNA-binding Zn-ribbon protein involved in translation (DUF1610 family)
MTKLRIKVDTFVEEHLCPECEEKLDGAVAMRVSGEPEPGLNNGLLFPHKCPECGFEVKLPDQYPNFIYLPCEGAKYEKVDEKKHVILMTP